jgi:SAM-dependent methyltransferase
MMTAKLTLDNRKFPSAHVIGNDISPIQPSWVAPNIEFIVEDFESEWQYEPNHFDFIHARCLAGYVTCHLVLPLSQQEWRSDTLSRCVADWPTFISRIYDHVKPGGYFESHESAVWARSDDGSLKQDCALMEWQQAVNFAGDQIGRELNIYHKLKDWMIAAGFEDVKLSVYALPFSPWPRDPHLKALGKYQAVQLQQAIDSYSLRLYTQVLGWGSDAAKIHNAVVKQELRDKRLHAYVQTYAATQPLRISEYLC